MIPAATTYHVSDRKRFVITGLLVSFSLWFVLFFKESETLSMAIQGFIVCGMFFLLIPILYSRIILRESLGSIGWQSGRSVTGTIISIVAISIGIVSMSMLIRFSPFGEEYALPGLAASDFRWFILYEAVIVPVVLLLYETFFRGLVQLMWLRDFPVIGVFAQTAIFYLFSFLVGGVVWQNAPLLIFAPFSGIIAWKSQSVWYSFAASWVFFFMTDVLVLVFG